jgi:hypothetical protein
VTSVGVVVNKEVYSRRARSQSDKVTGGASLDNVASEKAESTRPIPSSASSSTRKYLETLELAPGVKNLVGDGELDDHLGADAGNPSLVHSASDYSYSSDRYAGDGRRVIGDAGGAQWKKLVPLLC